MQFVFGGRQDEEEHFRIRNCLRLHDFVNLSDKEFKDRRSLRSLHSPHVVSLHIYNCVSSYLLNRVGKELRSHYPVIRAELRPDMNPVELWYIQNLSRAVSEKGEITHCHPH